MSKEWRTRPSEILGLDDPYTSFCLDESVWYFGSHIENQMDEAGKARKRGDNEEKQNKRRQLALEKSLGIPQKFATPPGVK